MEEDISKTSFVRKFWNLFPQVYAAGTERNKPSIDFISCDMLQRVGFFCFENYVWENADGVQPTKPTFVQLASFRGISCNQVLKYMWRPGI